MKRDMFEHIHVETGVLVGKSIHLLLNYIRERQVDMVVMYSHEHTVVTSWLFGNVTQSMIRHSPVPVFVIRDTMQLPEIPQEKYVGV